MPTAGFRLALLLLLAVCWGCGVLHHRARSQAAGTVLENPLFVSHSDREFVWDNVVDTIDNYFKIERQDRVKLIGDVLTEGQIDTVPKIGATLLEPWHKDSVGGYERLHASLQSVRRRAIVRVIPQADGYLLDVTVLKELEDVDRPQTATAGGEIKRHDGSLIREKDRIDAGPLTLGWIPQGRDAALEQRLVSELYERLTNVGPPEQRRGLFHH